MIFANGRNDVILQNQIIRFAVFFVVNRIANFDWRGRFESGKIDIDFSRDFKVINSQKITGEVETND